LRSKHSLTSIHTSGFCMVDMNAARTLCGWKPSTISWKHVRIAGRGYRVEAGVARGAMVGVVQVAIAAEAHGRVLADDRVGLEATDLAPMSRHRCSVFSVPSS
jgi:hypothetical protein